MHRFSHLFSDGENRRGMPPIVCDYASSIFHTVLAGMLPCWPVKMVTISCLMFCQTQLLLWNFMYCTVDVMEHKLCYLLFKIEQCSIVVVIFLVHLSLR